MQMRSGFGLTRPAWALAFGLPAREPEDLRPPRPPSRLASASHFHAVRGLWLHGTWRQPGTILLASVAPEGTVPSGALSVTSERPIRRALGREAANARITSKKSKVFKGGIEFKQNSGGPLSLQETACSFSKRLRLHRNIENDVQDSCTNCTAGCE